MKLKKVLLVIFVIMFSSYGYAQFKGDGSKSTIIGTPHDLSSTGPGGASVVCEFCHVPHKVTGMGGGAGPSPTPPLLWNIQLKTAGYATYDSAGSSTLNATDFRDPGTASSTTGASYMSLLCLSCHDGTVTSASFFYTEVLGTVGTIDAPNIGDKAGLGLANDHPVDFTYDSALATADGGLKTPTDSGRIAYVGTGASSLPLFKDSTSATSGRVECATCHNPHNHTNDYFLRVANTGSALCLTCHGT